MKYLLIWDIDGTLIQTRGLGKKAMNIAFLELHRVENAFQNIKMSGMLDPVILETAYELHRINMADRNSINFFNRYIQILEALFREHNRSIACAGVPELLATLDKTGCFYNVLGTGNIERGARIKLSVDDLNRFFPTGGFGDEETERWRVIEKALVNARNHFKIEFENKNIFVIGDTSKDIACGKKLGTRTIAVATGSFSCTELHEYNPDYVFENLKDTENFLRAFE